MAINSENSTFSTLAYINIKQIRDCFNTYVHITFSVFFTK